MTMRRDRPPAGSAGLLALAGGALLGLIVAVPAVAQIRDTPTPPDPNPIASAGLKPTPPRVPADPDDLSPGITACQGCHSGADFGQARGFTTKHQSNEFVLLNESTTWDTKDAHSIALAVLDAPLGKQMALLLDLPKDETGIPSARLAAQCLTCHSVDLDPHKPLHAKASQDFATLENGVNCTACHGLGRDWQSEHYREPVRPNEPMPWRAASPEYKFGKGMHDLRDPAVKSRLCVTCHVGSPDEGKVVTHEMYAAGHPPLPPFELAMFMESQPKHWGYPTDPRLKFFQQFAKEHPDETWTTFRYHPPEQETYLARQMAAGAIAALEAEARLLAVEAHSARAPGGSGGVDFARFDCYACHHELKYPSDRQRRGYEGAPGRPPLKAWVGALPGVIAHHAEGLGQPDLRALAAQFGPKWRAVRVAAQAKPFGDPAALNKAAVDLANWCDAFLGKLTATPAPIYTPEQANRLVELIGEAAASPLWAADPEAAMHMTWAYVILRDVTDRPIPEPQLRALDAVVPTRTRYPSDYAAPGADKPQPVTAYFSRRLRKLGDFDADQFRAAFTALRDR